MRVARLHGCFEAAAGNGNHVPTALGSSSGASVERSLKERELAIQELIDARRPETLGFSIGLVPSHRTAMRRHLGVGHAPLDTWKT